MSTRHDPIRLLADIAASVHDGGGAEEALRASLDRICDHMGWRSGRAFRRADDGTARLVAARHRGDCGNWFEGCDRKVDGTRPDPVEKLSVRVLESGTAAWAAVPNGTGHAATDGSGGGAYTFPVPAHGRPRAVLGFLAATFVEPDEEVLEVMGLVCDQLGNAIEREEARRALERSEEKFRNLIEGSIQGIYIHRDWELIFANQAVAEILGYDHPDEVLALGSAEEFVAPYERPRLRGYRDARMRGEEAPPRHVAEYLRKDGSTVFLESINHLVYWDGETVIQSTVIDITEQILIEDALRDSERQLRLVTDSLPVLITYVDSEQRYQFVNETAEKWYGRPRAEIVGRTLRELWGATAYETWKPYLESIREGWAQAFDETVTYPDGRTREVTESWVPHVAEDGEVLGYFAMAQDFTSRRRAERSLRESEERLKAILDHAPAAIFLKDTDGRYQVVNHTFEKNSGVTAIEAEGRTVSELFPGKFNEKLLGADQEVIESAGILETEYHSALNGRTFSVVKFPIRGADGAIAGVGTIETDITRRKEMMEALRASEQRVHLVADAMPGLMGYIDADLRFGFCNALSEVWLARPRAEIVGHRLEEVMGAEHYEAARPAIEAILAGNRFSGEAVVLYPDGVERHIHRDFVPDLSDDGKVRGFYYFNHDITERKRAEEAARVVGERFKAIVNNSPNLIYLKDTAGRYLLVNKEFERTIGLPLGQAAGKSPHDWAPAEDAESYQVQDRAVIESGEMIEQEELVRYGDGTVHTQILTKFPIFDAAGNVEAVVGINTDITERKEAEAALRESESLLTLAAEQANLGHWVWDTVADRCVYASQQLARILGLATAEEYVAGANSHESDLDWVHPDDRDRYDRVVREAFDKGLPFDIEYRIVRRDGDIRYVHGRCEPLLDSKGATTRAIGTLLEVTERKGAELAVRESEGRLRAIIDNAPVHISMKDFDGRHIVIGPNSETILGYPSEKVLGRTSREIFSKAEADFFMAHDRVVRESGRTITMENEITLPDGVHAINTIRFPIRDAAGEISAIGAISTDITDRKNSEEVLRERERLLAHAAAIGGLGHWVWDDLADKCILCSDQVAEIYGFASPEEFVAMATSYGADLETVHPEDREWYDRLVRESDRLKKPYVTEFRILRRDGEVRYVSEATEPILNDAGELVRTLGTIQDITERKEDEEALRERETLLAHAADIAGLGHWMWDDLADKCILCSDQVAEIYGYASPEEYVAMASSYAVCLETVHPEDRGWYDRLVRESDRLKKPYETEFRILRRDGEVRYVHEVADTILNSAGEIVRTIGTIQDITERKKAEAALRESERRFREYAEASADWFWETDADLALTYLSPNVERIAGVPPEWHYGKKVWDAIGEGYDRGAWDTQLAHMRAHEPFRDFIYYRAGQGVAPLWLRLSGVPMLDEGGAFLGYRGSGSDVTEQRRAEESLREREAEFRTVLDNLPAAVYLKDLDGRIRLVNTRFVEWYGLSPARALGKTTHELFEAGAADAYVAHDRAVLDEMRVIERQHEIPVVGGSPRIVRSSKFPVVDPDGRCVGVGTIDTDVTQLVRAERVAKFGHWAWDEVENRELYSSEEADRIWGTSPSQLFPNMDGFLASVHEEDRERVGAITKAALETGTAYEVEYRVVRADGGTRVVVEIGEPEFDETGRMVRTAGVVQDITERKALEDQLHQSQKMEVVGQLTGGIAHDFNNLLAVILGNSELVRDYLGDPDSLNEILDDMARAAELGAELTQKLLAFSRRQALRPRTIDAGVLAGGMTGLLRRTLGEAIDITVDPEPGLWNVRADPGQLESAILNLAINARDAMPSGGRLTIEVANATLDEDSVTGPDGIGPGDYVMLAVTDSGIGMSPEVLAHAVEPFFTTKGVGEGSGLGLSMVYGFARQSGGTARIYSEEGRGTTVRLYLPRAASDEVTPGTDVSADLSAFAAKGETVLLIEDDAAVRKLVRNYLVGLRYEVLDAAGGAGAVALLDSGARIDLLLTDLVLAGGMTGPDIAQAAMAIRPGLAVLFMSGYAEGAKRQLGPIGEDAGLLHKPFRRAELARKLRDILDAGAS